MGKDTLIDICVCTYKRDSLSETLASLEAQTLVDYKLHIIVADNDEQPTAKPLVERFTSQSKHDVTYIHAPKQNISIARNACLNSCKGNWVAFIDDDEIAPTHWLHNLLSHALQRESHIVLGPVEGIYNDAPVWMEKGRFHDTLPTYSNTKICSGYTCNVLFKRDFPKFNTLAFDLSYGKTGGEDTLFFEQAQKLGMKMSFAPSAWLSEPVPKQRASFNWLLTRRFRFGQTHARLLLSDKQCLPHRLKESGKALAKAVACYGAATLHFYDSIKWRRWAIRGALHIGVISRLISRKEVELYGH